MMSFGSLLSQKLYRAGEAVDLLWTYAADATTRKTLVRIYASLSDRSLYQKQVNLRLRIHGELFSFQMRYGDIFVLGEILHEKQYALQSQLPPRPVIVDAGANIGTSAMWFLGCYPDATLHAFEPASGNYRLLAENFAHVEGARIFQAALGKRAAEMTLYHAGSTGEHSLMSSGIGEEEERVPVVTLASHMEAENLDRIDLLKLDVEGSELDVLVGLGERIRDVRLLVGEVHEKLVDEGEFYRFLDEHGFRICQKHYFRESDLEHVLL
jgi:FkbM family methyltransferase